MCTPEQTDRELVILARQGDKGAFGCLIERYQAMAFRVALRMVALEEIAQDLVQESLLQAYLSLDDLQKEDRFRSWFYGIVLNVSKSYLREEKRRSRFSEELREDQTGSAWSPGDGIKDPHEVALERELHSLVLSALEELPSANRETARLYYYESLTLHEIVAITGASPGAIKVRLHRARNHLRNTLESTYPEIVPQTTFRERRTVMVKSNIIDILVLDEEYLVLLQDERNKRILPMWIGPMEGRAIALGLRAYPVIRPMTYDFMVHLLETLGAQLEEVRIEVLKDYIFYGIARLRIGNEVREVDARPSDVLALAVRTNSPIYVAEEILQQESKELPALEKEFGPFTPGEGIESIVQEFEEKKFRPPAPQQGTDPEPPGVQYRFSGCDH
jgi:RNA polymerase sigma factor (sigma-70 family)